MSSILGSMSNYLKLKQEVNDVTIVVASKYMSIDEMNTLYQAGARDFGENRSDALLHKINHLPKDIKWHFIGHLQSNKVKSIINKIDYLHSLDRLSLAKAIQKHRKTPLKCFIQINMTQETHKSGIAFKDVDKFLFYLNKYDKIQVIGFMVMGVYDDLSSTEEIFKTLESIKGDYKLSMGMSDDYKLALKHHTDFIRIGSLLKE